jgi:hypothetical protein
MTLITITLRIMGEHCYAEYRLCWVSFMLSIVYAEYRLCWVSFMLSVIYAVTCKPFTLSVIMLNVVLSVVAPIQVEPFMRPLPKGKHLTMPSNIRLGWEYLSVANTLAYCGTEMINVLLYWGQRYKTFFVRDLWIFILS